MKTNTLYALKNDKTGRLLFALPSTPFRRDQDYFDIGFPGFHDVILNVKHDVWVPELNLTAPASLSFRFQGARTEAFDEACSQYLAAVVLENGGGVLRFYDRDTVELSEDRCRAEVPLQIHRR